MLYMEMYNKLLVMERIALMCFQGGRGKPLSCYSWDYERNTIVVHGDLTKLACWLSQTRFGPELLQSMMSSSHLNNLYYIQTCISSKSQIWA